MEKLVEYARRHCSAGTYHGALKVVRAHGDKGEMRFPNRVISRFVVEYTVDGCCFLLQEFSNIGVTQLILSMSLTKNY